LRCSKREWLVTQWKWRNWARQDDFSYPIEFSCGVDSGWRRKQAAEVTASSFADILRTLLPLYIPVVYLEGLISYRQKAFGLNLRRPKVVFTANSLHGHTLFKILVADWRDEGTKVLDHQHGGGYGIDRVHPLEEYETRVADCFYTLGWRSSNPKQIPLVGALSASQAEVFSQSRLVMLMCVCYPKQVHRIHLQPMPGTIETLIAETANFIREMKGRQELLVRPYFHDYGWGMVETLRQADSELIMDDLRKSGIESYARSSLVVHNYLGTSWLETLAMNIPTVCFYDADTYAFREDARPYLDALSGVGVLHKSGAAAATFVLGLKNDPHRWWQTAEVQDARLAFVRNYANYSPNWAKEWETEFKQWIE
jgi:putative transferase (TIGR04331 family)